MTTLDTTFLIALDKQQSSAQELYENLVDQGDPLRLPAAVWTEYLAGIDPVTRAEAARELAAGVRFEPFTRVLADEAARLQHELYRVGEPTGWHDLQVATTALHYDEPLVTTDRRFDHVPGLAVIGH